MFRLCSKSSLSYVVVIVVRWWIKIWSAASTANSRETAVEVCKKRAKNSAAASRSLAHEPQEQP